MTESMVVAFITGGMALLGTVLSNSASHSKTMYRIEQLEKKQDIHNSVIERMYCAEKAIEILDTKVKVANHRLDDLESEVK